MKRRVAFFLFIIVTAMASSVSATAHDYRSYYTVGTWGVDRAVPYYIDNDVPSTGGWRASIKSGLATWSDRNGGRTPEFVSMGQTSATRPAPQNGTFNPCSLISGSVVFRDNDLTATLGASGTIFATSPPKSCFGTGRLDRFIMVINTDPDINWNSDDGLPGNNQWDLRSVTTHEAGHATGWAGHFATGFGICSDHDSTSATMCEGSNENLGTYYRRTLLNHDTHTLTDAY